MADCLYRILPRNFSDTSLPVTAGVNFGTAPGGTPPPPPAFSRFSIAGLAAAYVMDDAVIASGKVMSLADRTSNAINLAVLKDGATPPAPDPNHAMPATLNAIGTHTAAGPDSGVSSRAEFLLSSSTPPAPLAFTGATPWFMWAVVQAVGSGGGSFGWLAGFTTGNGKGFQLGRGNPQSGNLGINIQQGYNGPGISVGTTTAIVPGNKYTLLVEYDGTGTAAGIKVRLNGTLEVNVVTRNDSLLPSGGTAVDVTPVGPFTLGSAQGGAAGLDLLLEVVPGSGTLLTSDRTNLLAELHTVYAI